MSGFHKLISNLKSALEHSAEPAQEPANHQSHAVPVTVSGHRVELCSLFARELEAVNGHFLGTLSPAEVATKIGALARELGARTAALGESVEIDAEPIAKALQGAGVAVIRPQTTDDDGRIALRNQIAGCDMGVAEAHYAVAATGTLAVVATPRRPNSLTLLPPINVIIVHADRVLSDLAAVVAALGAETFATHRVSLITGPSRTADIEKMIVLGVHGPKQLYVAMVWPQER
ncbi:MAG: LutC/YkgG family protein [Candidatus Binataceae bacterium]